MTTESPRIIEMAVCEFPHIIPRLGVLYRFYTVPNCANCQIVANANIEDYGIDPPVLLDNDTILWQDGTQTSVEVE
jgi:hypothetical protein